MLSNQFLNQYCPERRVQKCNSSGKTGHRMESNLVQSTVLAGQFSDDLSIWGLFVQADFIVKAVMVGLFVASFWCWAIIFEKII